MAYKKKETRRKVRTCTIHRGAKATKGYFIKYIAQRLDVDNDTAERMFFDSGNVGQISIGINYDVPGYGVLKTIHLKNEQ